MNPLVQRRSGTTPDMSRNAFSINLGTNEDDSQSDPHPEAGLFNNQMTRNFGPEDGHYMVTRVTEQTRNRHYMVTGATERHYMVTGVQKERLCDHDMMTGATEQIRSQHDAYCSPGTSPGKQKKNRSTSQPHFRSQNTPATIEADQFLLALQQLANNNNSALFPNNIFIISKLPKSLTSTMPTFDGKSEKFELFENLFPTILENHNQLTEEDRINYFHSLMRGDALQTFKNINGPTRENLPEMLPVFRRKYVKSQSMATAKHKFQKIVFKPANRYLVDFLD